MKKIYAVFLLAVISLGANAQWTRVNVPHDNLSFISTLEVPNDQIIWGSISNLVSGVGVVPLNKYVRSIDNGSTWVKKAVTGAGAGFIISNIAVIDADTAYIAMYDGTDGFGGGIYKTTDAGTTWNQVGVGQIFDENSFPDFVYFWDAQHGMALGDRNFVAGTDTISLEVYTTEDYGNTWVRVPTKNLPETTDLPIGIVNNYAVVGNTMWAQVFDGDPTAGAPQYVYKSTDQAHSWVRYSVDNTLYGNFSDITFTDEFNGVVIGLQGDGLGTPFMQRTNDGGETWQNVPYSGPLMGANISNVPGTSALVTVNGVYIGPQGSSYSWDLGNTWTLIDTTPVQHTEVKFFNSNVGWTGEYRNTSVQSGGMYRWTGTVLPITLSSFSVTKANKAVALNWSTANESNFDYFGIERSTNGTSFTEIGKVKGAGNSSTIQQYSFADANYSNGKNYYRLKLVNKDGSFNYSQTQWVDMSLVASMIIKPNPVTNKLILTGLGANTKSLVSIINNEGKTLMRQVVTEDGYTFNVNTLPSGNYYLRIEANGQITNLKFVKD